MEVFEETNNCSRFKPSVKSSLSVDSSRIEVERIQIKPGIQLASFGFKGAITQSIPFKTYEDSVYLISCNRGSVQLSLPDYGVQTLKEEQWAVLTSTHLSLVKATKKSEIIMVQCETQVFASMVQLSHPPAHSSIFCLSCPQSLKPVYFSGDSSEHLARLARVAVDKNFNELSDRLFAEVHCLKWMGEIILQPSLSAADDTKHFVCSQSDKNCLQQVADFLKTELDSEHSLKGLSRRFNINERKLKEGFKTLYNATVFGYLRECRLQHAEALIRNREESVLDVAVAVGYSNPSHFARCFKERFGMLPKAYQAVHNSRKEPILAKS